LAEDASLPFATQLDKSWGVTFAPFSGSSFAVRLVLALASGGLYSLAYPPLGWRWLVVPAVLGLLVALNGQRGPRARAIGFLHGLAAFGVGLSWLYELFGVAALLLWCVLAAFPALFAHFQGIAAARGVAGWKLAVFTALNWGGCEFIRAEVFPLKFPWMTAGLAIGPNRLLPWIGVYGVGAILVLGMALLAARHWRLALGVALVLTGSLLLVPRHPVPGDETALKVAGIQKEDVTIDYFLKASRGLPAEIPYVVWPEYAVPYDIRADKRDWDLVQQLCRDRGITLTFGTQRLRTEGPGWRNIALTVDPTGVRGEHNKVHTVHYFDDGMAGSTALPVETKHGRIGTPVCFDCDYEGVTRRMTAAGAEAFIVPVMDAESWTAREHDQHAELFRIRACENGRWMFVCATSGVSQVIDPHGQLHGRLGAMTSGTLVGSLKKESRLTFYTRFGWLVPWTILASASACWIGLLLPRRRHTGRAPGGMA
jgi:apolipoprotein N-acyltransferase